MEKRLIGMGLCALVVSGAVFAHSGATGIVKERMDRFKESKQSIRALRGAIRDGDSATIDRLTGELAKWAAEIPDAFPANSNPPPSEARDRIWEDWQGFVDASTEFEAAALRLQNAGLSEQAGALKALGASCKACHQDYRQ